MKTNIKKILIILAIPVLYLTTSIVNASDAKENTSTSKLNIPSFFKELKLKKWWSLIWWMTENNFSTIQKKEQITEIYFYKNKKWCKWKEINSKCYTNKFDWFWIYSVSDISIVIKPDSYIKNYETVSTGSVSTGSVATGSVVAKKYKLTSLDKRILKIISTKKWINKYVTYSDNVKLLWKDNYIISENCKNKKKCILNIRNSKLLVAPIESMIKSTMPTEKCLQEAATEDNWQSETWCQYCYNLQIWWILKNKKWSWRMPTLGEAKSISKVFHSWEKPLNYNKQARQRMNPEKADYFWTNKKGNWYKWYAAAFWSHSRSYNYDELLKIQCVLDLKK